MNSLSIRNQPATRRAAKATKTPGAKQARVEAVPGPESAPHKRRPGRSDLTRAALIAAAQRVFLQRGYVNTEIAQITREAGRATGTFYVHFDGKLQILQAMVEQFSADLNLNGLDSPEHPPEAAPHVLRVLWKTYRKHSATFRALVEAAAIDPDMAAVYEELRGHARRDYRSMLRGSSNPAFASRRDQDLAASALDMMISGCMYEWLAVERRPGRIGEERAFQALVAIVKGVLGT
jgi:AcrR family transcriptional regulator